MAELTSYERYRIILRHEFVDDRGRCYDLNEPLTVEYTILRGEKYGMPQPILLNEMIDKLKMELCDLAKKEAE